MVEVATASFEILKRARFDPESVAVGAEHELGQT
jgi:hypothetical protein